MHFKEANNFDLKWNVPVFYKCFQNLTKKFQILDTEVDSDFKKISKPLKEANNFVLKYIMPAFYKCFQNLKKATST